MSKASFLVFFNGLGLRSKASFLRCAFLYIFNKSFKRYLGGSQALLSQRVSLPLRSTNVTLKEYKCDFKGVQM